MGLGVCDVRSHDAIVTAVAHRLCVIQQLGSVVPCVVVVVVVVECCIVFVLCWSWWWNVALCCCCFCW